MDTCPVYPNEKWNIRFCSEGCCIYYNFRNQGCGLKSRGYTREGLRRYYEQSEELGKQLIPRSLVSTRHAPHVTLFRILINVNHLSPHPVQAIQLG